METSEELAKHGIVLHPIAVEYASGSRMKTLEPVISHFLAAMKAANANGVRLLASAEEERLTGDLKWRREWKNCPRYCDCPYEDRQSGRHPCADCDLVDRRALSAEIVKHLESQADSSFRTAGVRASMALAVLGDRAEDTEAMRSKCIQIRAMLTELTDVVYKIKKVAILNPQTRASRPGAH